MKKLETLPDDIYALFNPDNTHECNEEYLEDLCSNLKELLRARLRRQETARTPLRFSSLGKPDRQLWYEAHPIEGGKEPMTPKTYFKFLYGDVIEQLVLYLTKEAGHSVEQEQGEVEVDGVFGHIDAIIDGVVVDVKSASPYGYQKFKTRSVEQDDPFGYVAQLAGYSNVLTPGIAAAWVAMDKVSGDICVSPLSATTIRHYPPEEQIKHQKEIISLEEPPKRCHEPIADGKSGNYKLPSACSYCAHKFRCHPNLRTFLYSNGPRFLTQVSRVPDVPEVNAATEALLNEST